MKKINNIKYRKQSSSNYKQVAVAVGSVRVVFKKKELLAAMCGLGVWFFFFLPFQLLVLYVSVAVTGIYNMSIAYTPYTYVVLKTEAVYLVKIPKLWKIIRGNHNV